MGKGGKFAAAAPAMQRGGGAGFRNGEAGGVPPHGGDSRHPRAAMSPRPHAGHPQLPGDSWHQPRCPPGRGGHGVTPSTSLSPLSVASPSPKGPQRVVRPPRGTLAPRWLPSASQSDPSASQCDPTVPRGGAGGARPWSGSEEPCHVCHPSGMGTGRGDASGKAEPAQTGRVRDSSSSHRPPLIPGHASSWHRGSARRVWGTGGGHRKSQGPQGPPCLPDASPAILLPRMLLRTSLPTHHHAPPDQGPPPTKLCSGPSHTRLHPQALSTIPTQLPSPPGL